MMPPCRVMVTPSVCLSSLLVALLTTAGCTAGTSRGFLAAMQGGSIGGSAPSSGATTQSTFTPAAHSAPLQVVKLSGSVLTAPTLQIVTFNNDPQASQLADFGSKLPSSSYWTTVTGEYGIGALTTAPAVAETFAWPQASTDGEFNAEQSSDIESYLVSRLDGTAPAWGAPNATTLYALLIPAGIVVSPDGGQTANACDANILGWHTAMLLPTSQVTISYIVVPDCGARGSLAELDVRTTTLSHEIVEATLDPQLNAFAATDPNHLAWSVATGNPEVGSACAAALGAGAILTSKPADLPYAVARSWSNTAARGSHQPCVPASANEVFFSAPPLLTDTIQIASPPAATATGPGVQIAAGQSGTVLLQLYSDATTPDWAVSAQELGTSVLTLSLDKASGNNGDTLTLTINVGTPPQSDSQELVMVTSILQGRQSNEFFVVHN